jgi:hypothetical protein
MKCLYLRLTGFLLFSLDLKDASEMKLIKQVHKHTLLYKRESRWSRMQLFYTYLLV